MSEVFSGKDIQILHGFVAQLAQTTEQEDPAIKLSLFVSKRLRDVFPSPVEAIKFFLHRDGHENDAYLAKILSSRSRASDIMNGKKRVSITDMRVLRDNMGVPSDLLLDDPTRGKGQQIDFANYPIAEMARRGLLPPRTTKRTPNLEDEVRQFFGSAGLAPEDAVTACLRRSIRRNEKSDPLALQVWLAAVRRLCMVQETLPYTSLTEDLLRQVATLSVQTDGPVRAIDLLRQHGIKVVIVPHFASTYLDGAVFMMDGQPVIGMTLRYDRLDYFWHTLLHELSHIVLGHAAAEPVFDDLEIAVQEGDREHDADLLAQRTFIPDDAWKVFMSHRTSAMSVCALAAQLSISPAIVAGRYRFETRNYRIFSNLVGNGEVRRLFPECGKAPRRRQRVK